MKNLTAPEICRLLTEAGKPHTNCRKITKGKLAGTFCFKRSFFYTHGYTSEKFAEQVAKDLQSVGLTVVCKYNEEQWNNWPKTSWWCAWFEIEKREE